MIVWLWDACEPGQFRGVTDDETRAREAAEACLTSGQANAARVEKAFAVFGITTLADSYRRAGEGWRADRRNGRVAWVPFAAERSA